jgi:hypothetical protein
MKRIYGELVFALAAMVFAYWFSILHVRTPEYRTVTFAKMVEGTAWTPQQYRALLPWFVRQSKNSRFSWLNRWTLDQARLAIDLFSCIALLYAARLFWRALGYQPLHAMAASGLFAVMLPFQFFLPPVRWYYCYDIAAIAFFTLGLYALLKKAWPLFYLVFILGTLNRETTAFLVLIYLLVSVGREPWKRIAGHALAQTAIWVAIKVWLWSVYHQTGATYTDRLDLYKDSVAYNLQLIDREPHVWIMLAANWAFLWILAFAGWRRIGHPFVARALWVVPVFVGAMFFVGELLELRIYSELIPIVAAAALFVVARPDAARA